MGRRTAPVEVSEEQVLWFRARRWHLAGPGAPDVSAAARSVLGAQSQQLGPSLLALSQRMAARPTAKALEAELWERRTLVRTWGQRDTLFVYDPAVHWADVVAARAEWSSAGRRMLMPKARLMDKARRFLGKATEPITRTDVLPLIPDAYARECDQGMQGAKMPWREGDGTRFAAGRVVWKLAHDGELCHGPKRGAEQAYEPRGLAFPALEWGEVDSREAALRLAREYLSYYGPATAADLAYFFNAKVTSTREWVDELRDGGELVDVHCGERAGLVLRKGDRKPLTEAVPKGAKEWPVRLLPLWDAVLMGHADKRWAVPHAAEEKLIWKKAAVVAATVVDRGRLVATWSQKKTKKLLSVQVEPLSGWRKTKHLAGVKREAKAVAAHLEIPSSEVTIS